MAQNHGTSHKVVIDTGFAAGEQMRESPESSWISGFRHAAPRLNGRR